MYGEGISKVGELIDLGVKAGVVEKSGSWFSYDGQRIGQGRENAKTYLREHPEVAAGDREEGARQRRHPRRRPDGRRQGRRRRRGIAPRRHPERSEGLSSRSESSATRIPCLLSPGGAVPHAQHRPTFHCALRASTGRAAAHSDARTRIRMRALARTVQRDPATSSAQRFDADDRPCKNRCTHSGPVRRVPLRGRVARPGHQHRQRKPVVALVLQPARGHRDLRHRHRRHAFLRRPGTELGRRGHEIFAADQRPVGMDRAALLLEERAGHAEREVGRRQLAIAAPSRAPSVPPPSIAASAAAKRARSVSRRSAGIASTSCSSRSPSVRETGTSWRQQAPQPLRQEIALPASAASTTAFTRPCRAGTTSAAGTGGVGHGDRMGDPEVAHREAQSCGGMGQIRPFPAVPRCGRRLPRARYKTRMQSVSDIRRTFLEYFAQERPRGRGLEPARAAQRPDADVHQRRHGAVQERLHRPGEAALQRAPRPRRSACAPAASTTTSRMSATPRATTPSSRCWATSRSATTSRSARSSSPGT